MLRSTACRMKPPASARQTQKSPHIESTAPYVHRTPLGDLLVAEQQRAASRTYASLPACSHGPSAVSTWPPGMLSDVILSLSISLHVLANARRQKRPSVSRRRAAGSWVRCGCKSFSDACLHSSANFDRYVSLYLQDRPSTHLIYFYIAIRIAVGVDTVGSDVFIIAP